MLETSIVSNSNPCTHITTIHLYVRTFPLQISLLLCTFVLDSDSNRTRKQEEKEVNTIHNSYLCGHTTTNFLNWIKIITSKINKISTNNLKILGYIYIYIYISIYISTADEKKKINKETYLLTKI